MADASVLQLELDPVLAKINEITYDADDMVRRPLRQTLINSGKLLRPSMLIWAAGCGDPADKASVTSAAAAIELLHTASLIHDDIIDKGDTRRGLPCVHSLFGNSVAVYSGDFIIVKCFQLLHDSGNDALLYHFVMASEKLCKSEIQQYQHRGKELDKKHYMEIAAGKTGALFALALYSGAWLGGLPEKTCQQFAQLGERFGIAFQILDDCLDYRCEKNLNKSTLSDLKQGLYTMPMILALQKDDGRLRALLKEPKEQETLEEICSLVDSLGGIRDCKKEVRKLLTECRQRLMQLPAGQNDYFGMLLNSMEEHL